MQCWGIDETETAAAAKCKCMCRAMCMSIEVGSAADRARNDRSMRGEWRKRSGPLHGKRDEK